MKNALCIIAIVIVGYLVLCAMLYGACREFARDFIEQGQRAEQERKP